MSASLNIILFGETGVGKSSVINLIAGQEITRTSGDVLGCTLTFKEHAFNVNGLSCHIWDTVGLGEPEMGINDCVKAIEQAWKLIQSLSGRGGVDLLLFCIRGNRVTATVQSNYRLFYEVLCRSEVPIALVITHLEREDPMEGWWERNKDSLEKYGIKSAGHACVTGLPNHRKYGESRENIRNLLGTQRSGRFTMPPEEWYAVFLRLFGISVRLKKNEKPKEITKFLTKRCRLDQELADKLAATLASAN